MALGHGDPLDCAPLDLHNRMCPEGQLNYRECQSILWSRESLGPVSLGPKLQSTWRSLAQGFPLPHSLTLFPIQSSTALRSCLEGDLPEWAKEKLQFRPGAAMSVWHLG